MPIVERCGVSNARLRRCGGLDYRRTQCDSGIPPDPGPPTHLGIYAFVPFMVTDVTRVYDQHQCDSGYEELGTSWGGVQSVMRPSEMQPTDSYPNANSSRIVHGEDFDYWVYSAPGAGSTAARIRVASGMTHFSATFLLDLWCTARRQDTQWYDRRWSECCTSPTQHYTEFPRYQHEKYGNRPPFALTYPPGGTPPPNNYENDVGNGLVGMAQVIVTFTLPEEIPPEQWATISAAAIAARFRALGGYASYEVRAPHYLYVGRDAPPLGPGYGGYKEELLFFYYGPNSCRFHFTASMQFPVCIGLLEERGLRRYFGWQETQAECLNFGRNYLQEQVWQVENELAGLYRLETA